jgi:endonuclease IV
MPIGYHVSKSAGGKKRLMAAALKEAIDNLPQYGFTSTCAQIFVSGPQNFKEILTEEDIIKCKKLIIESGITVVIHGAYVDHPWNRSAGSVHNIKQELRTAARIGATGVIVHLGAGTASDENLKYVLDEISNIDDNVKNSTILWLEIHTAKPSGFTYETPAKLQALFNRVSACEAVKRGLKIGLCIDTAHLFSCGNALDTAERATNWLNALPDVPIMLHLNDSASNLGSGIDKHMTLMKGQLWSAYHPKHGHLPTEDSGLVAILNWAESNDIVTILERNEDGIIEDLNLIRSLGYFQD